jgi:2-oxoisovalerate dehydrogenase E1 component
VTGGEASPSISKVLERAAIARTEEVAAGLDRVRLGFGKPAGLGQQERPAG